jgi:O-succinylbenzoic acid--CoA ligase
MGGPDLLTALSAALDGTGPAILPLDQDLPASRLRDLIAAFAPTAIVTAQGVEVLAADSGVDEDVAVVLTTSGSTGTPKGAELTAGALLASARASLARIGGDPGGAHSGGAHSGGAHSGGAHSGRWLCCLPTHHISGLGVLVRSLVSGVEPVFADRVNAELIAAARCDYVSLVPTQLRRLLDAEAPVEKFSTILLGGATTPVDLLDDAAAAGARVVTTYGMTETCGGCVYDRLPLDGVRVATDGTGLIRIGGSVLFSGYRLAPELTKASIDDGWFVTSDLGEVGPDGRVQVRGRADDVINTGGEKVVPAQVERALRALDCVRDAVVVGAPDAEWGERVTAIIVSADLADPPSLATLRLELRDALPRYAAPGALVCVSEIPMLASGKPDRLKLRMIAAGQNVSDAAGGAGTEGQAR